MRIAYAITRADAVGGASIHVRDLAQAMQARGDEVTVLVGGEGPVTEQLAAAGVRFRPLLFLQRSVHPLRDARAFGEFTEVLRELQPDLVSTHTAKAGWIGRAAAARLGILVIHTPHGLPLGDRMPGVRTAIFGAAERVAARWSRLIICVCEQERRLALARHIARPQQLEVVYNGVRDISADLRSKTPRGTVRIISVARFEPPKDHSTLLRAMARLNLSEWQLELVGDGPLEAQTRALAAQLGIASRVRFLGYQADTAPLLAGAHLFVLATRSEAFPRSILEAMRAGLAVVASNVGGIPEAICHGENGLLVPREDPAAMAAAISEAVHRPELGRAARCTYEARFRLEHMVERMATIYESVLPRNADRRASV